MTWLTRHRGNRKAMADLIGKDPSTVSNYLGKLATPSLESIVEIANHYDLTLDELVLHDLARSAYTAEEPSSGYGANARMCSFDEEGVPIPTRATYLPNLPVSEKPWLVMPCAITGMEPTINRGDLLVFREVRSAMQFTVCIVVHLGQPYIGRVKQDVRNGEEIVEVIAENPSVPTQIFPRDEVTGFYQVESVFQQKRL